MASKAAEEIVAGFQDTVVHRVMSQDPNADDMLQARRADLVALIEAGEKAERLLSLIVNEAEFDPANPVCSVGAVYDGLRAARKRCEGEGK